MMMTDPWIIPDGYFLLYVCTSLSAFARPSRGPRRARGQDAGVRGRGPHLGGELFRAGRAARDRC